MDDKLSLYKARKELQFVFDLLGINCDLDYAISGGTVVGHVLRYFNENNDFFIKSGPIDIDIYSFNNYTVRHIEETLKNKGFTEEESVNSTKFKSDKLSFDLIKMFPYDYNAEKILDLFDISACGVMIFDNDAVFLDDAIYCIRDREIRFHSLRSPFLSLKRLSKYCNRGFTIDDEELGHFLKLQTEFNQRNANNGNMSYSFGIPYSFTTSPEECIKDVIRGIETLVFDNDILRRTF